MMAQKGHLCRKTEYHRQEFQEPPALKAFERLGKPETLLITGPPGIGKTWLIRHLEEEQRSQRAFVVRLDAYELWQAVRQDRPDDFQLIRNNFVFHSLKQVFDNVQRQVPSASPTQDTSWSWSFMDLRQRFRERLEELRASPGLVLVDHLSEVPENLQRALVAAWMFVVPDTGHTLVIASRIEPKIGPWIRISEGNVIRLEQGLSKEQIQQLLETRVDLPSPSLEEVAQRISQWSEGHPWMARCLIELYRSHGALHWVQVQSALKKLLRNLLSEAKDTGRDPGVEEEIVVRVLHLLSWLPWWHPTWMMEVWKEWHVHAQEEEGATSSPWHLWRSSGQRALLWLRRNGFLRRERSFDRLAACSTAFFTLTTAYLGVEEAQRLGDILERNDKLQDVWKVLQDRFLAEGEQKEEKGIAKWTKVRKNLLQEFQPQEVKA